MENINGNEMNTKIHAIFSKHDNTRTGRIDTLNEICELGKEIIESLNTMDKNVSEIEDDFENCLEDFEQMQKDLDSDIAESNKMTANLQELNPRIEKLEAKIANGETLTEEESEELRTLYAARGDIQEDSQTLNNSIKTLSGNLSTSFGKISNYQNVINDVMEKIDGYAEAGQVIKEASKKYGRNINSERVMERNETSWWNFLSLKAGQKTQMDRYTEEEGLTEISHQVFYSKDSGFVPEYDAIENKGGNQVGGGLRKATVKTFSYGDTIESASKIVQRKAAELDALSTDANEDKTEEPEEEL